MSIAFDPTKPFSKLARAAAKQGASEPTLPGRIAHGVAFGTSPSTEHMVLISQPCDLIKPLNDEPNVLAMPVFRTDNVRILRPAAGNSSRYFLLDSTRTLIVDARAVVVIEKPLLESFTPEVGIATEDQRKRFARWLARRFHRPAIDDRIVAAVVRPFLENLRRLQASAALDMELFDRVCEVRLHVVSASLPYTFDLLFMAEDHHVPEVEVNLVPLLGAMRSWFQPEAASLRAWYARSYADISVADYSASEQLYLDEYSYEGGTIRGLVAPNPG